MSKSDFFEMMPKIELHAHLSGSITIETVAELMQLHKKNFPEEDLSLEEDNLVKISANNNSFDSTYQIFSLTQKIVDHPDALKLAATRVIEEFAGDNVRFLELRSTPRDVDGKMSKEEYVESIVGAIQTCSIGLNIQTKYLVSIDRRLNLEEAQKSLDLCLEMNRKYPKVVVGIELSGDARVGDARDFLPLLKSASAKGLKVTVHLAEISNHDEVLAFLGPDWRPDRIGHGTCIHPDFGGDSHLWETFLGLSPSLPVEICVTSNSICKTTDETDHQVLRFHQSKLPFVICTDDKGVFKCSLSGEYEKVSKILNVTQDEMFRLSFDSIDFAFAAEEEKEELKTFWSKWKHEQEIKN